MKQGRENAADLVPRRGLLRRLDAGSSLAATLVSAPRGFGKTTLVRQWAASACLPVAVLRLSAADGDVAAFSERIAEAIWSVSSTVPPSRHEERSEEGAATASRLGRALARRLHGLEERVALVLDDYWRVGGTDTHALVDELLREAPEALHLVIVTRHDPPLSLQRLVASGSMQTVRAADLAFTWEETVELLRHRVEPEATDAELDAVMRALGGWPAGLRLLALALVDAQEDRGLIDRLPSSVHEARGLLAEEIIASRSPPVRRALVLCTLVERFDRGLCAALLASDPDCAGLTSAQFLDRARVLVVPDDEQSGWYRLSGLFRDVLEQHAAVLDGLLVRAVHDRVSAWFSEHGRLAEAADHAARGSDPRTVADLIACHRIAYLNAGRLSELHHALELVPPDVVNERLVTCLLQVWLAKFGNIEKAIERVERKLEHPSTSRAARDGARGELHLMRLTRFACRGLELPSDLPEYVRHGRQALRLLPGSFGIGRATAAFMFSLALMWSGDLDAAHDMLDEAIAEHAALGGEPLLTVQYAQSLLLYQSGALVPAGEAAELCTRRGRDEAGETPTSRQARGTLAAIHYEWNELEEAARLIVRGRARDELSHTELGKLALVRRAEGRPAEAVQLIDRAIEVATRAHDNESLAFAHACEARLALMQGRNAVALRWAASFPSDQSRSVYTAITCTLVRAEILALAGSSRDRETAQALLAQVESLAARSCQWRTLIRVRATEAMLCDASGDDAGALTALREALRLSESGGFVRTYVDLGPRMQSLLSRLDVADERSGYVRRIREAFAREPVRASGATQSALPDPLTDRELDILSLLAQRLSNKEIAARLFLSVATVKTHASAVYQKLHVSGRREAVEKAVALGIVQDVSAGG